MTPNQPVGTDGATAPPLNRNVGRLTAPTQGSCEIHPQLSGTRFQKETNMSDAEGIKVAFERIADALAHRPSLGHGTGVSKIRVTSGLRCEIREGPWHLTADMPAQAGGTGSAPTPGVLMKERPRQRLFSACELVLREGESGFHHF